MTMNSDSGVSNHYTVADLGERILAALRASGKDPYAITVDDLAPIDEFHIRGRVSTQELAQLTDLQGDQSVLDVGCGLGGTGRYLADTIGCRVIGIDLTDEYCRVAEMLSERVGLKERTEFRQGSAIDLPFDDGQFDVVWTEHVQMNIPDKSSFYGEIKRVLKPGEQLAFHDIFAGGQNELHFPVPWAEETSISHLIPAGDARDLLVKLGFTVAHWQDKTSESTDFFRSVIERVARTGLPPLGLHMLMGESAGLKFQNMLRNLEEDRIRVIQAVFRQGG